MSNVRGKISIDVQFADSTTSAGVQSLKTITLQDTIEYTSGKVAIVTGTVGLGLTPLSNYLEGYLNAAGQPVQIADEKRLAFRASPSAGIVSDSGVALAKSLRGEVSVVSFAGGELQGSQISSGHEGTSAFTLLLYGT